MMNRPKENQIERLIDIRSDTVTQPSSEMRKAMAEAVVGDDVFGEDPTVNELQRKCADLFGMEEALFVSSGSMANLIAILVHCSGRGSEMIAGDLSHIHKHEQGSYAQFGGVSATILPNENNGTIDLRRIENAVRNYRDVHQPKTQLLCLENTHNMCGGCVLPLEYLQKVKSVADKHDFKIHMDGARIMNASVASGIPVNQILQHMDSVSMCLSKGIGAPVGSVLGGSKEFICQARRVRKALGGGWRQAGVLAAAGLVGLASAPTHIAKDHENAMVLTKGLADLNTSLIKVSNRVTTNIVHLETAVSAKELTNYLLIKDDEYPSVAVMSLWENKIRMLTNWGVNADDIETVVKKFAKVLATKF